MRSENRKWRIDDVEKITQTILNIYFIIHDV